MRKKLFTFLLAIVASIGTMFASDIQVNGIWYNFDSSTQTAEVTYHGSSSNTYSNEYTGAITVPTSVLYNGVTYTVTSIGDYAFYLCSDLTSIEIPNSVTRIGASAFNRCSGLTSMDIPNSVTSIGAYVFYLCSGLTSMSIGNSVTTISSHAFDECSALASVMIPTSVANIEEGAFRNCSALTTIDIPNSVTSIGESAFRSCTGLTSIAIPNSVTTIGNGAFAGCWVLSSIEIPNSLTSIGESAFSGCRVITSITNYATMPQVINASTFNDLNKYACTLYVPAESVEAYQTADVWKEFPHIQAIDSTEESDYISVAQALEIGATLDANASTDTTYTIRGYVSFITTPFSEQYLDQTFYIADDSLSTASSNAEGGFYVYCGKPITGQPIKEGALVELTTAIKNYNNRTIENAEQKVPVTVIQEGTCRIYSGTCGAQGDNITWIFNKCDGILTISGTGAMDDYTSYSATPWSSNRAFIKFVIIEDGVTSIGSSAFDGCRGLTSVTIPNSVTSIGDYAFYNCSVLTSITNYAIEPQTINANVFNNIDKSACTLYVPAESVEAYKAAEVWKEFGNIVAIEGDTPEPCIIASGTCGAEGDNLTWTLSCDSVLTISGTGAMADYEWNKAPWFSNAANIVSVEISDGITSIGDYAFNHCSKISSVSIPSGVTSIGFGAFNQCFGLTSVNMPNTLISIGESAFVLDTSLTSITIPSSVTYIGNWAFENHASKITSIICEAVNPPVLAAAAYNEPEVFLGIDKSIPLYVPAESIELYRTAAGWKEFGNIVAIGSEPEESNYATIADIYNMAADSAFTLGAFDVVYVPSFQNGSNMYIKDSTGSGVIYMPNYGLQAGDHVEAGLQGKVSIYHGLHEIAPVSTKEELTITSGEAPAPMEATEVPSATNVNQYVIYKGVSFSTDTAFVEGKRHAVNGIWNGHTITFYNQYYMSATLSAGKTYNIIAVNTIYGTIPQAYPLAVEEVSSDTPDSCVIASGTCGAEGDNLTWTLTCDSVLTISGTGAMADFEESTNKAPWASLRYAIRSTIIENGVTNIGNFAFHYNNTTSVAIPNSVTQIGHGAFYGCHPLESVAIPNSVTTIEGSAFRYCRALTSVSIPSSVQTIGSDAFEYCDNLETVYIPSSVISIGNSAFAGNKKMRSINVDEANPNYSSIDGVLFNKNQTVLVQYPLGKEGAQYTIPNTVTTLESMSFSYFSKTLSYNGELTSIVIPNSVTMIYGSAFWASTAITSITNYAMVPQVTTANDLDKSTCTLYVPAQSLEAYQAADFWKDFADILPIEGTEEPIETIEGNYTIYYVGKDSQDLTDEIVTLHVPVAPVIEGFTFLKWVIVAGDLEDGIAIQAVYEADMQTGTPEVYTNPANHAQKLLRNGHVYILTDDRTYTIQGQRTK